MHPAAALACALAAPFAVGFTGSLATQPALKKPHGWYRRIVKPKWTPPDFCFPLVWTLLYAAMGVASWRVWLNGGTAPQWTAYAAQLALNGAFSPLFFSLHRPWAAFVDTMLLLVATVACIGACSRAANKALFLTLISFSVLHPCGHHRRLAAGSPPAMDPLRRGAHCSHRAAEQAQGCLSRLGGAAPRWRHEPQSSASTDPLSLRVTACLHLTSARGE